jgi:hypothetical protein
MGLNLLKQKPPQLNLTKNKTKQIYTCVALQDRTLPYQEQAVNLTDALPS